MNFCLVKTPEYFQRFQFDIRYKPGKTDIIPDALFRLANKKYRPSGTEKLLNALSIHCYPVNLIQIFPEFKSRFKQKYEKPEWQRFIKIIKNNNKLKKMKRHCYTD